MQPGSATAASPFCFGRIILASVIPADETKEDSVLDALTWESSDEKIAKVISDD